VLLVALLFSGTGFAGQGKLFGEVGYLDMMHHSSVQQALSMTADQKATVGKIQAGNDSEEKKAAQQALSASQAQCLDQLVQAVWSLSVDTDPAAATGLSLTSEQSKQLKQLIKRYQDDLERLQGLAEQAQNETEEDNDVAAAIQRSKEQVVEEVVKMMANAFATQTKCVSGD
jgi:hypothetical protein